MWHIQAFEIREGDKRTGRYRLTATSDEDGGGPFGDTSHDHATVDECHECEACDEYVSRISGFMSKKRVAEIREEQDRKDFERLSEKFAHEK